MVDKPNVILLSIDALRADHLSYHGYERDTSPFLDELSEEAITFTQAISASSHTREALPALLSGRYPDVFAANGYRYVSPTVADRLSEAGYKTAGFHSNPYVSRAYGFDSGFDTFDDDLLLGRNRFVALAQRAINKFVLNRGEYHVRAEDLNDRALEWLDSLDGDDPFFLWNHYMDPHGPYNPPDGYTYADRELSNNEAQELYQKCINRPEEITEEERKVLIDSYDGEIRYIDDQLRAMFDALSERNFLEDSLVILTADHGDAFGEHGYFTHPRRLHDSLLHVPLLIFPSSATDGAMVSYPVSTLDIVPSILDYAGIEADGVEGTSWYTESNVTFENHEGTVFASATGENDDAGIRRFAARGSRWKGILTRKIASGEILDEQLFDLETDPNEKEPLAERTAEQEEILQDLREFSSRRLEAIDGNTKTGHPDETTSEVNERLEALGYK